MWDAKHCPILSLPDIQLFWLRVCPIGWRLQTDKIHILVTSCTLTLQIDILGGRVRMCVAGIFRSNGFESPLNRLYHIFWMEDSHHQVQNMKFLHSFIS